MSNRRSSRRIIVYGFLMVIVLLMAITGIGLNRILDIAANLTHAASNSGQTDTEQLLQTTSAIEQTFNVMSLLGGFGVLFSITIATLIYGRISNEIQLRLETEQNLRDSELRERIIRENIIDGVLTLNADGTILSCNKACKTIFGYEPVLLLGQSAHILLPYAVANKLGRHLQRWEKNMIGTGREVLGKRSDGRTFPAEMDISKIELDGAPVYIVVVRDISDRKAAQKRQMQFNQELERQVNIRTTELARSNDMLRHEVSERVKAQQELTHLATHDVLTGLPNRSLFNEHMEIMLQKARRHQRLIALLFLDLDGFKAINDTHGHNTGDALLREVSERMRRCMRKEDILARMGGDEFTILLGELATPTDASLVAMKLIKTISEPMILNEVICHVGASIGISLFPDSGDNADTLLRLADDAMYAAKSEGKNTFRYAQPRQEEKSPQSYPLF
jgi:diguanylate cyclase (GGDEF)-like protein/PAS domain S-box-containing protein